MDNSYSIIAKCTIKNRNFAITQDKKIVEEINGEYVEVLEDDLDIQSISQRKDRLLITSKASEAKKWNIYMI